MIPVYPCGTAVEMMRHVYEADYNFNQVGDNPTRVRWFFCADGAKWLDVPTVYNSDIWLDRKERDKAPGILGEIPGTRKYAKSKRPIGETGQGYCGTPEAWLGQSSDSPIGLEVDVTGSPLCCTGEENLGVDSDTAPWFSDVTGTMFLEPSPIYNVPIRYSAFAWELLSEGVPLGWFQPPYEVALLRDDLYGGNNLPPEFEAAFPGYQRSPFQCSAAQSDPDGGSFLYCDCGPFHYECTGPVDDTNRYVFGYAVLDAVGYVLFYELWSYARVILAVGEYIDVSFQIRHSWDLP